MAPTDTERPPSLRERQRQERETLILAEAERMLAERGYHDLTMEELADRVGIGKGTIYLHFPKKEDLVRSIVERGMARMAGHLEAIAADAAQSAESRLRAIIVKLMDSKQEWVHVMSDRVRQEVMESLHDHAGVRHLRERLIGALIAVIEQGKANGEFDRSVSTPVAALGLFTIMRFPESRLLLEMFNLDRAAVTDAVIRLYFRGLCTRSDDEGDHL